MNNYEKIVGLQPSISSDSEYIYVYTYVNIKSIVKLS